MLHRYLFLSRNGFVYLLSFDKFFVIFALWNVIHDLFDIPLGYKFGFLLFFGFSGLENATYVRFLLMSYINVIADLSTLHLFEKNNLHHSWFHSDSPKIYCYLCHFRLLLLLFLITHIWTWDFLIFGDCPIFFSIFDF